MTCWPPRERVQFDKLNKFCARRRDKEGSIDYPRPFSEPYSPADLRQKDGADEEEKLARWTARN